MKKFDSERSPVFTLDNMRGDNKQHMPLSLIDYSSSVKDVVYKHRLDASPQIEEAERFAPGNRRKQPVVPYVSQYNFPNAQRARRLTASQSPDIEHKTFDKISNQEYRPPLVHHKSYHRGAGRLIDGRINQIIS